jgi:hypothetical protein
MTEIIAVSNMYLPAMNVQVAIQRRNELVGFVKQIMKEGVDYGKIPGAGDKPTLLKPGAEKLTTFFGLSPSFLLAGSEEDWDGVNHNGEPFFYYRYRCELYRMGNLIAGGEGSCNSHESKYRYRKGERVCPECGASAIIKGKAEYGGGWLCFGKKGGCGAKFKEGDTAIESQETGRILNADVADQVNTFQKMAQKRALIAATLLAVNASEFFTQDVEDMVDIPMAHYAVVEEIKTETQRQPATTPTPVHRHANANGTPSNDVSATWKDEADALRWGFSREVFSAKPHCSNAYNKVKAENPTADIKQIYKLWIADVERRVNEKNAELVAA